MNKSVVLFQPAAPKRRETDRMFTRRIDKTIANIDKIFDTVDQAQLVFKEGLKNYLYNETPSFNDNLRTILQLRTDAELLRREIENDLYRQSAFVRMRGDIMRLLERVEHIILKLGNNLEQFDVERPFIPVELNTDFIKLAELSTQAVETAVPAARAYFRSPEVIFDRIHRVYFYASETGRQAQSLKRHVFHELDTLKLSQKIHLRYFALHIEELSAAAAKVADQLSVMAIKRTN